MNNWITFLWNIKDSVFKNIYQNYINKIYKKKNYNINYDLKTILSLNVFNKTLLMKFWFNDKFNIFKVSHIFPAEIKHFIFNDFKDKNNCVIPLLNIRYCKCIEEWLNDTIIVNKLNKNVINKNVLNSDISNIFYIYKNYMVKVNIYSENATNNNEIFIKIDNLTNKLIKLINKINEFIVLYYNYFLKKNNSSVLYLNSFSNAFSNTVSNTFYNT